MREIMKKMKDVKNLYDEWNKLKTLERNYAWYLSNKPLTFQKFYWFYWYMLIKKEKEIEKQAMEWSLTAVGYHRIWNEIWAEGAKCQKKQ